MVRLSFTSEYTGLILLLNAIVILLFLYSRRTDKERAMKFGNFDTLKKISGGNFLRSNDIIMIIRILGLTLLLIGLSSPLLIHQSMGVNSDFVIALDSSASMFTGDIEPNRFDAAKEVSKDFVSQLGNSSRVGLISYAGSVNQSHEMSRDRYSVIGRIDSVGIGEEAGTATGDAVAAAASMLAGSKKNRTVIVITDGRNTVGQSINDSADFARRQNVTVNTIGIGNISEEERDDFEIINGNNASQMQFPNLNRNGLNYLANTTGGEAVFVSSRDGLESAFVELEEKQVEEDISKWFFLLAGALMVIEAVFRSTNFQVIP